MTPNFLFIGPDKTGSSWLFDILRKHPECYVPECKDIYYFDRYYDKGMNWYLNFFKHCPHEIKVVGELSHDYILSEEVARRISSDLGPVKIITCLRDPVERSFSHYLYMVRSGITNEPFETAVKEIPAIIDNSMYHKHLSAYFKYFEESEIKVLDFDQLKASPMDYAREVFTFLNVEYLPELCTIEEVRPASAPRSYMLAKIVKTAANIVRDLGLPTLVGKIKHSQLNNLLYRKYKPEDKPTIDPEFDIRLRKHFHDDLASLEVLLNKDFSRWKDKQYKD